MFWYNEKHQRKRQCYHLDGDNSDEDKDADRINRAFQSSVKSIKNKHMKKIIKDLTKKELKLKALFLDLVAVVGSMLMFVLTVLIMVVVVVMVMLVMVEMLLVVVMLLMVLIGFLRLR